METENTKSTEDLLEMILAQANANGQQNAEMIASLQQVLQQVQESKARMAAMEEQAKQQAEQSGTEIAGLKKMLQGMQEKMGEMQGQIDKQDKKIAEQETAIAEQQKETNALRNEVQKSQRTLNLVVANDPKLTQETMEKESEASDIQLHLFQDGEMYLIQDKDSLQNEQAFPKEIMEQLGKGNAVVINNEMIIPVMVTNEKTGEQQLAGIVSGEVGRRESDRQKFAEVAANYADVTKGVLNTAKATYFEKVAMYDPLTELSNKNGYKRYLQEDVLQALQAGEKVSMILIDGDKFKDINETYGHEAGDAVLKAIAETMRNCAGKNACVARDGGDEFLIILPCDGVEAYRIAEEIRHSIETTPIPTVNKQNEEVMVRTTISAGIAEFAPENPDKENVLNQFKESKRVADERLSKAKGNGQQGHDEYGRALQNRNVIKASPEIEEQLNLEREVTPTEKEVTAEPKTNAMDSVEVIPFPEDTNELVSCTDGVYTAHVPVTVDDYAELLERAVPSSPDCPETAAEALKSAGEKPHFEIVTDKDGTNCELTVSVKDFRYAVCLTDDEKQQLGEMMQQAGILDIINECIEEDKECAQNF